MHVGLIEIVVVVCVGAACFGPDKLPVYARKLGQKLAVLKMQYAVIAEELKNGMDEIRDVQDILEKPAGGEQGKEV